MKHPQQAGQTLTAIDYECLSTKGYACAVSYYHQRTCGCFAMSSACLSATDRRQLANSVTAVESLADRIAVIVQYLERAEAGTAQVIEIGLLCAALLRRYRSNGCAVHGLFDDVII